jgi:hypothetical protein
VKTRRLKINTKKYFYFLFALVLISISRSNAQTNELAFGAWFFNQTGTLILSYDPGSTTGTINYPSEVEESNAVPGFSFIHYHPLHELSDELALGAEGGLNLFMFYEKKDDVTDFSGQVIATGESSGLFFSLQVPVYATARFLNGSTESYDEGFGAGAGIGGMFQGFEVPEEKGVMFSPVAMVELKYDNWGARFDYLFSKFKSHYTSSTGDIPRLETSFFNISISLRLGD